MDILSNIAALHLEHNKWREDMRFYHRLIKFYRKHLAELATDKIEEKEFMKKLEVIQNELLIEEGEIRKLHHIIDGDEKKLSTITADSDMEDKIMFFNAHLRLNEQMEQFYCLFNQLKKKYLNFCIKWQR
ncbi:hypothetical protein K4L44_07210 [Halosquirtibacter laminarini]|uniref:Uncharacterized protein n=1 Tax=Halosquirtibacter laminarini TaxID=3374600 RepID=A0AC61NIR1_9BACT|nr:hypothetical protein K4L44_07210 [Prolixibacteraceae bacterium]